MRPYAGWYGEWCVPGYQPDALHGTWLGHPLHPALTDVPIGAWLAAWHGSTFRLADGTVRRGPATVPQPVLTVRVVDGRVEARRS